jgi:hypothetical protein
MPAAAGDWVIHLHILDCLSLCSWLFLLWEVSKGGHLRSQTGVLLKCELSMVAGTGNNQAQYPEVAADST